MALEEVTIYNYMSIDRNCLNKIGYNYIIDTMHPFKGEKVCVLKIFYLVKKKRGSRTVCVIMCVTEKGG